MLRIDIKQYNVFEEIFLNRNTFGLHRTVKP